MNRFRMLLLVATAMGMVVIAMQPLAAQDQNISEGRIFDGEPCLAMHPQDPDHLVVAWMGFDKPGQLAIKTRYTTDGGQSWSPKQAIPHTQPGFSSADPTMAFDSEGNLYLSYIDFIRKQDSGQVVIRQSKDGGQNWGSPQTVISAKADPGRKPIDRPWMVIDTSSGQEQDNIYITTMNAEGADTPYHAYFHQSADKGQNWQPWQYLDSHQWRIGSQIAKPMPSPVITSNGTFHAVYPSFIAGRDLAPRYLLASSSAGKKFSYQPLFPQPDPVRNPLAKTAYLLKSDPTNSAHLVFFYFGKPYGDADLLMRESFDRGQTWSQVKRVNDDPLGNNRMQDMVWADFDQEGDIAVVWRDRRNAGTSGYKTATEMWGAVKRSDSGDFSENFQVSGAQAPYDSVLAGAGNDFMSLAFHADTLYAVWGDTREASLNIWFRKIAANNYTASATQNLIKGNQAIKLMPNPARNKLKVTGKQMQVIQVFNMDGRIMYQATMSADQKTIPTTNWESGVYQVRLKASDRWLNRTFIKQ